MYSDWSMGGVFLHRALVCGIFAFILHIPLRWGLARAGFYNWVWHSGLVDIALLVLLWAGTTAFLTL
jgi:hypothetical protein